jgi:hypothetical protein
MEPFIYLSVLKVKEGAMQDFLTAFEEMVRIAGAEEPRLIGISAYVDEGANEVTLIQIHPDPDSMVFHMQVMDEHISHVVYTHLESATSQILGTPNDEVLEKIRSYGTQVTVKKPHAGLFRISETPGVSA